MKKLNVLLLATILCVGLVACGGNNNTEQKSKLPKGAIELTKENYSKYVEIKTNVQGVNSDGSAGLRIYGPTGYGIETRKSGGTTIVFYDGLMAYVHTKGKSTNFNYNDVTITVKITGTYKSLTSNEANSFKYDTAEKNDFDEIDITVETDVVCEGLEWSDYIPIKNGTYTCEDLVEYEWEIVEISGYITPA